MKRSLICVALLAAFVVSVALPADVAAAKRDDLPRVMDAKDKAVKRALRQAQRQRLTQKSALADEIEAMLDSMNVVLESAGADYRAARAEYITDGGGQEAGATIIQKDVGNKRLGSDFVPGDVRRAGWSGDVDTIDYAIDTTGDAVPLFGGLTGAETDAAITRAMATWDAVSCSQLGLDRNPDFGVDIGVVAFIFGFGGSPFTFADVQHAGFRDLNFSGGVLGVAFTFVFIDNLGNPTDVDGNGRSDTAFREIYYDPSWSWADDGVSNVDVETVAVHEAGHGLSQAHFGNIKIKNNGTIQASPRAVMNALYTGPYRELAGTDNGGHCSNWASWPNN